MKPPPFNYYAPTDLSALLELLQQHGEAAKILAGGQSLIPDLNFRQTTPGILIDVNQVPELVGIEASDNKLTIGAMVRQAELAASNEADHVCPLFAQALKYVGYQQTRNRGTLGGSLAFADPMAELPAVTLAADAEFELCSAKENRLVKVKDFYVGKFATVLQADELLLRIHLPNTPPNTFWQFVEQPVKTFGKSVIGVAIRLTLNADKAIEDARVALCGAGDKPLRIDSAEKSLIGSQLEIKTIDIVAHVISETIEPPDDVHATPALRKHLAKGLSAKALKLIQERAEGISA